MSRCTKRAQKTEGYDTEHELVLQGLSIRKIEIQSFIYTHILREWV